MAPTAKIPSQKFFLDFSVGVQQNGVPKKGPSNWRGCPSNVGAQPKKVGARRATLRKTSSYRAYELCLEKPSPSSHYQRFRRDAVMEIVRSSNDFVWDWDWEWERDLDALYKSLNIPRKKGSDDGRDDASLSVPLLVQRILQRLDSPEVRAAASLCSGGSEELKMLERRLFSIQDVLDAETSSVERRIIDQEMRLGGLKAVEMRTWLLELSAVLYDADDAVDEFATAAEASHWKLAQGLIHVEIQNCVLSSYPQCLGRATTTPMHRISATRESLDHIMFKKTRMAIMLMMSMTPQAAAAATAPTTSILGDESCVFGRQEDKKRVIELLLMVNAHGLSGGCCPIQRPGDRNGDMDVPVIPILSDAGLGKTTLAKLVYNSPKVENHFDMRLWVYVSDNFDIIRLIRSIIQSATGKSPSIVTLDGLQAHLSQVLSGNRFLLVLDNLWNEICCDWDVLRVPFRAGAGGSRILVTTRSPMVSSIVGTSPPFHLQPLSFEDCWSLFKHLASGDIITDDHLVSVCEQIVKDFEGFPSLAKALGSFLHSKMDRYKQVTISNLFLKEFSREKCGISSNLRLAYHRLPAHLKQCFAYCAIFPKRYKFEKNRLVLLWMAEGFLQPKGMMRMEDLGLAYFKELLEKSFFQCCSYNCESYVMPDLVHDLAQSVSGDGFCRLEDRSLPISENARHLSLCFEKCRPVVFEYFYNLKGLHTFLYMNRYGACDDVPDYLFVKWRCLRVLDLSGAKILMLPSSIGHLQHLRYLDLSENDIGWLPESISTLHNLQTLKLRNCYRNLQFPKDMAKLFNLRHLDLGIGGAFPMPLGIGKLRALQTLPAFAVYTGIGRGIGELKDLTNLRGELSILNLGRVLHMDEAKEARLDDKQHIQKLRLEWDSTKDSEVAENILAGLQPHTNLKNLKIVCYGGIKFPIWMGSPSFSNLETLSLLNCTKCEFLPPLGQLPSLKFLSIKGMLGLKYVNRGFNGDITVKGFPSLNTLELDNMPFLEEWIGLEEGDMPCLNELKIVGCMKLIALPTLQFLVSLQHLHINVCPELRSLPEEGLPTSLQSLTIVQCPLVSKRCKRVEGEDWCKIEQIPNIEIDYKNVHRC